MLRTNKSIRSPYIALATGLVVSGLLVAGDAGADATDQLEVSVEVEANCSIVAVPLDFGNYDPVVTNASAVATGSGGLTVTCTTGAAVTVTLDQGLNDIAGSAAVPQRRLANGGGAFLAYQLSDSGDFSTVWSDASADVDYTGDGAADTLTVFGRIGAGQNVPTGIYTDTVLATVVF
jgi:spore coat protein U-like protein